MQHVSLFRLSFALLTSKTQEDYLIISPLNWLRGVQIDESGILRRWNRLRIKWRRNLGGQSVLFVIRRVRRNVEDVVLLHIVRENVRWRTGRRIKILARQMT